MNYQVLTKNCTANKKEIWGNTWTVILAILWQTEGRSWVTRTESLGERFCGTEIKTSEVGVMPFGASTPEVRGAQTWESVAQGRCFKAGYGSRKNNKQQQTTDHGPLRLCQDKEPLLSSFWQGWDHTRKGHDLCFPLPRFPEYFLGVLFHTPYLTDKMNCGGRV